MLVVGQQSTFPKLLFIQNRMKIERLIEEGLLLGGSGKADMEGIANRDRESIHMHGQAIRSSAEPSTEDEHEPDLLQKEDRRSSILQELKRQSGVFFDDFELDDEETGISEDETAVNNGDIGHDKIE